MGWLDIFNRRHRDPASFVLDYEKLFQEKIAKETAHRDLIFTVVDTETTGLNSRTDEIVSYGSLQVEGNSIKVSSVKEYYLKPSRLNIEAIKVHGIVRKDGFIAPQDFVSQFLSEIGNTVLVAHHAGFDKAMLEKAAKPFGLRQLLNPIIDTYALAIRLEIGRNYNPRMVNGIDYSLDKLCERYYISLDDRHTASGDAFLTAQLFLKLLKKAEKTGINTYGELLGW